MPKVRHHLYLHVVWTTLDRGRLIDTSRALVLQRRLPAIARQERAVVIGLGMVATHVHLLIRNHPATGIPRLIQRLKGTTSHDLVNVSRNTPRLHWAKGYTVESVSRRAVLQVLHYLANQPAHHPNDAIVGLPRWTAPTEDPE